MRRGRPGSLFAKGLVPTDDVSPGLSPILGTSRTDRPSLVIARAAVGVSDRVGRDFLPRSEKQERCPEAARRDRVEGLRLREEADRKR